MQYLADISSFLALTNSHNTMGFDLAVFNKIQTVDELKDTVDKLVQKIEVLRELMADTEADNTQNILNDILNATNDRFLAQIKSTDTLIADLKQSNALAKLNGDDIEGETEPNNGFKDNNSFSDFSFKEEPEPAEDVNIEEEK